MMYYEEYVLFSLASSIGTQVKIDINSQLATRACFTRVCVAIDLRNHL